MVTAGNVVKVMKVVTMMKVVRMTTVLAACFGRTDCRLARGASSHASQER